MKLLRYTLVLSRVIYSGGKNSCQCKCMNLSHHVTEAVPDNRKIQEKEMSFMIEIIGKIREATPEEVERFRNIQKKLAVAERSEQKGRKTPSFEDKNS